MCAVLVADHNCYGNLAVGWHTAARVGLAEKGVHPLEYGLGDTRWLAEPDRRTDDENVGFDDPLAQRRPCVAFALVGLYARFNIMIDGSHDLALGAVLVKCVEHLLE